MSELIERLKNEADELSEKYYTKAQVDSYKRRIKELEVKLSLGRCGSCKKTCEAGILNRKVCDPK